MNKSSIPNFFTFFNLSLGIISILMCFNENIIVACVCILIAALIDRYDGKIARKFNVSSLIGKELDSLSDLVSFGVASSIILWKLAFINLGLIGYIIVLIFPICGAFRLARFNISEFDNIYTGIPITIAGSLLVLDSIATYKYGTHTALSLIFVLLLSYMMVSSIKIRKF